MTDECQQASKSKAIIDIHVLKHPIVSLNNIFHLFDTLIKPIITYGCAVGGTGITTLTFQHTTINFRRKPYV